MYGIMSSTIFHYLLIAFIPFFTCFSYSLFLPGIIHENKLYEIVRYKFSISLHILMNNVLTYIKNNLILSVISPVASSYFSLLFQIIFIYCYAKNKIHIKIKKLRIIGIECDIDGDTYEFSSIREEKAACLKRKGNQNDIIENDINLHGTAYNIDSFGSFLWDNYILGHLTIRNPNFDGYLNNNNISITFDCEVNYPRM